MSDEQSYRLQNLRGLVNGDYMLMPFEEYERLRADLAAKDKRVEELGKESEWKAMKQLLCADYHIITDEQIDAAWARTTETDWSDYVPGVIDALGDFGIISCEKCGGSGLQLPKEQPGNFRCIIECPTCHGHGWILDNAP